MPEEDHRGRRSPYSETRHTIGRREFLKGSVSALTAAALFGSQVMAKEARPSPPNIVLINCDDLGYGDLGCYGSTTISTPNVDQLAKEGVRFTDFYAPAPVCTPSRAGLLTGRYPMRVGLPNVLFPDSELGLSDKEITIAQMLKVKGYATSCVGKWHLGDRPQFLPTRHGFDYYYGIPYSNDMDSRRDGKKLPGIPLYRNEKIIEQPVDQDTITQRYTRETIKFIREHKNQPFFAYLAHTMPHVPIHVSKEFKGHSNYRLYADVVEELDWSAGEVMKALREESLDRNTILIFTSDNGPWVQFKELGGSPGPLAGGKNTVWEGGMREPFVVRWPDRIPAGIECRQPASMLDMLPTFSHLTGAPLPNDRTLDGRDITPLLTGSGTLPDETFFYFQQNDLHAARFGRWKLHVGRRTGKIGEPELYDLVADIGEKHNVAAEHPRIVAKLKARIESFQREVTKF